jgi:hypothetical protein
VGCKSQYKKKKEESNKEANVLILYDEVAADGDDNHN